MHFPCACVWDCIWFVFYFVSHLCWFCKDARWNKPDIVALVSHNGFHSSCHSKADGSAWTASPGASACHCTEKLVTSLCCNHQMWLQTSWFLHFTNWNCFQANQGNKFALIKTCSDVYFIIYMWCIWLWCLFVCLLYTNSSLTQLTSFFFVLVLVHVLTNHSWQDLR